MKIKIPNFIREYYQFVRRFIHKLDNHHIFLLSAAISFNTLLYVIPLILVGIFIATLFLDKSNFTEFISNLLFSFLPETEGSYYFISNLLLEINNIFLVSKYAGWIGIVTLLWLSSTVFSTLRNILNVVFEVKSKKIFVFYKLKDILLTLILTIFILLLTYAMPLVTIISKTFINILPQDIALIISKITKQIIWIVLYFIVFFFIYKFIPSSKIPLKIVLTSSLICTLLGELARQAFSLYLIYFANYSKFYGTYALLVSILIWIYYLFFIILFSAELSLYLFSKEPIEYKNAGN